MMRTRPIFDSYLRIAMLLICLGIALGLRGDAVSIRPARVAVLPVNAPAEMLWAWEEPEDLRTVDVQKVGVAFLAERVFVGDTVQVVPRRQAIQVPQNIWAEAVVRIETRPGFRDSEDRRFHTVEAVLHAASLHNIHSVQIDFDATASQHAFYADVLGRVRRRLPQGMGLTMTALVSWCAEQDGWLHDLPVDSAVAMNFRLGEQQGEWPVNAPLCAKTVGVSTDEVFLEHEKSAPVLASGGRVYLFAPRPWTAEQLAAVNRGELPMDTGFERVRR